MNTLKNILGISILFGFLMAISSCALFKKNCDCPKFNQQAEPAQSPEMAIETIILSDSTQFIQLRNIE